MDIMTHEEIDAMPAGREMDALVAEKVMEWSTWYDNRVELYPPEGSEENRGRWTKRGGILMPALIPSYSTSIADAWLVVEKIKGSSDQDLFTIQQEDMHPGLWEAGWMEYLPYEGGYLKLSSVAATAPLAICRAALKAVQIDEQLPP